MLATTLYAWLVVLPAAHAAREALRQSATVPGAVSTEALAFARLHRLSGLLNGAVMLAGVLALAAVGLEAMSRAFEPLGFDHVVLHVRDQAASERFYVDVLGCTLDHVNKPISLVQLRFGEHLIDLLPGRARGGRRPGPLLPLDPLRRPRARRATSSGRAG